MDDRYSLRFRGPHLLGIEGLAPYEIQDLLDREVLQAPWVRPRWLDVPGAQERLDRLRAGASVTDLYEGDMSA